MAEEKVQVFEVRTGSEVRALGKPRRRGGLVFTDRPTLVSSHSEAGPGVRVVDPEQLELILGDDRLETVEVVAKPKREAKPPRKTQARRKPKPEEA